MIVQFLNINNKQNDHGFLIKHNPHIEMIVKIFKYLLVSLLKNKNLCLQIKRVQMLIVVLFVIYTTWKQPRYPSVNERLTCGPSVS